MKKEDLVSGESALEKLIAGNKRFASGKPEHPNQSLAHMKSLTAGQAPFAVIIGCSDSRVPPEIIFDSGIGDLFVIRVAGNIVDDIALGSIEYAVGHLGTPLVVVLGHTRCGAVDAVIKSCKFEGHIGCIADIIKPAVERTASMPGDRWDNAVRKNTELVVENLKSSEPILVEKLNAGELKIIAAIYDIESGHVSLI